MARRKHKGYFKRLKGAPEPLVARVKRQVNFREVDIMGIVWHGRYSGYFEEASAALGRKCGLSYKDFYEAGLAAPIVQLHIDYYQSLRLNENFTITASLLWNEAARLNTGYEIKKANGTIAAAGCTVQMFIRANDGEACLISPLLLKECRRGWKAGKFKCLK